VLEVLLLNLGGPDRLEDVGPLYLVFDPEIIRILLVCKTLAWLISAANKQSQETTGKSGAALHCGTSPRRRKRKLLQQLQQKDKPKIYLGMRYWHLTEEAIAGIKRDRINGTPQ